MVNPPSSSAPGITSKSGEDEWTLAHNRRNRSSINAQNV